MLFFLLIHKFTFFITLFQFDFGFVDVVRAKAFKVRLPSSANASSTAQTSASLHRLDDGNKSASIAVSSWNCDGEIIEEPNLDVR